MSKKRYVRKKKKKTVRGGLLLVLLGLVLGLVLFLVLRPGADGTAAVETGDGLWDGSWYGDDLGRIEDEKVLLQGMKAFEQRTGSRPYLTLLSGIDPEELDVFAEDQYEALFSTGDHVLVVYDEWGEGEYYLTARTGALSALTEADVAALLDCIETAYADPNNGSYAAAFSAGFSEGARRAAAGDRASVGAGLLLALGIVLILLSVVLVLVLRRRIRTARRWDDRFPS